MYFKLSLSLLFVSFRRKIIYSQNTEGDKVGENLISMASNFEISCSFPVLCTFGTLPR
jgi:hypothetical protein